MEIEQAPVERRSTFACSKCTPDVRRIRLCENPREDLNINDSTQFPMRVIDGGELYGFCPGKATWDPWIARIYQSLVITHKTGTMYEEGPLSAQPAWYVELLSWFLPLYDEKIFLSRLRTVFGDSKPEVKRGDNNRGPARTNKR